MADKEPRRRKKRRESQKKEEVRSEDHLFTSLKQEPPESDQEIEEEIVSHSHHSQPGSVAKFIFVILFSGLVVSMSFLFISLRGVDKGTVDMFDGTHDDHHAEALHDEHLEQELHDKHDHDEEPGVSIEDFIPGLSSIFSLNDEHIKESESTDIPIENKLEEDTNLPSYSVETESTTDQGVLEKYVEDTTSDVQDQTISEIYPETYTPSYSEEETHSIFDYSEPEATTTPYVQTSEPVDTVNDESDDADDEPGDVNNEPRYVVSDELDNMVDDVPDNIANDESDNIADDEPYSYSMYDKIDITNEYDFEMRDQLDEIDDILEKSPDKALLKCDELLKKHPESPRLHYLKAQTLDKLAEVHRSNKYLEEAIAAYQKTMSIKNVPEKLYLLAGKRAADRLRFRGFTGKSIKVLTEMSAKYPLDIDLKNQVAVGYLLIGQNQLAKKVLLEVLKISPDSGVAKVHLGFILKTDESNYKDSIKYLSEGIASRETGVIDGRFYFHLGDALHRSGKKEEALKVYEDAVKEGLFLSVYQRSLYNVDNLTGKPWWNPHSTRYAPDFKLLEKNWVMIRDEALSLISEKYPGFMPEAEGLQEKGDWKQLELFARGRKLEKNCQKAPKTCALISQIPDAASCKRGQVKFSIMHPGTHVWAHTGPTNCRLRAHLGLVVPEGVSIRVADETRKWEEGKVILFDDSFEHEVWHNGTTYRLVLIVDFWHPELSVYQKRSLTPI